VSDNLIYQLLLLVTLGSTQLIIAHLQTLELLFGSCWTLLEENGEKKGSVTHIILKDEEQPGNTIKVAHHHHMFQVID
jgi:hypothetical protein